MFSTNLPTETLYKTCFTLGIILFVFVFTVNQNSSNQLRIKNNELKNKTLEIKLIDSINLNKMESYLGKIISNRKILTEDIKWLDKNRKDLSIEGLKEFNFRIDSIYNTIEKLDLKIDSISLKIKKEEINSQKLINEVKMIYDEGESSYHLYFWILYPFSVIMIMFGFTQWSKNQKISDKTAQLNLEKIELEVQNLKLLQKKDIIKKPRSAKGSLKDQKPSSENSS
jgi:hypothetical protein